MSWKADNEQYLLHEEVKNYWNFEENYKPNCAGIINKWYITKRIFELTYGIVTLRTAILFQRDILISEVAKR